MESAKIKASQMFVLIVLFEMGSAILFGIGAQAKQDAWISVIMGLAGGMLLFWVYYRLYQFYPDLPFTGYVQKITGKWMGRVLGIFYVIYFIYCASRVLRDFGELLTTTIYIDTPIFVVNCLMMLTIIYGIQKGFEVLARVGELFFIVIYLMAITGMSLILFSGLIQVENLQPVLENGWMPVFRTFAGETLLFPFGEMLVFTMLLPYINDRKKVKIVCLAGMLLSGLNIIITVLINLAVLGVDIYIRSNFPLLSTIGKIQMAEFIERLDVFFMLYLIIGGFFKISIFTYAAVVGTVDIFQFKDQKKITFPIGLIVLFSSLSIASNYAEHIKEGLQFVPVFLHWPFQIVIPSLLLVVAFFRNRKKIQKREAQGKSEEGNFS